MRCWSEDFCHEFYEFFAVSLREMDENIITDFADQADLHSLVV